MDFASPLTAVAASLRPHNVFRPLQVADRGKQPIKAAAGAAQQCDSTHLGAQAAHVVEILEAMGTSMRDGGPVAVSSNFVPPAPMDWAAG